MERVAAIAEKHGVPRIYIALAWLLQKEQVTAPIIGATKISHLEDAAGALSIKLTPEEVADIAKNGKGAMPAGMFKGSDEELQKLAEFISGLESK